MKTSFWKNIEIFILSITVFWLSARVFFSVLTILEYSILATIAGLIVLLDFIHGKATGEYIINRGDPKIKAGFSKTTPKQHIFVYKIYFLLVLLTLFIVTISTIFLLQQ